MLVYVSAYFSIYKRDVLFVTFTQETLEIDVVQSALVERNLPCQVFFVIKITFFLPDTNQYKYSVRYHY